jgi:4a-hydroxytetrahydrobiopterin dehydratase
MWQETAQGLYRKFVFKDFDEAFIFMRRVAVAADWQNHHPRWTNEWNTVEIWLSTHDAAGKITDQDRRLAAAIDKIIDGESPFEIE